MYGKGKSSEGVEKSGFSAAFLGGWSYHRIGLALWESRGLGNWSEDLDVDGWLGLK